MFRLNLWSLTRVLSTLHTRPRVQPAPDFPCALLFLRGTSVLHHSGANRAAGRRFAVWKLNPEAWCSLHPQLSSPGSPSDPVRRGLSVQALTSLEYWIARLPRAMTAEEVDNDCARRAVIGSAARTGCRRRSRAGSAHAECAAWTRLRHCVHTSRRNCRHGG
jgi:hypothetical protein